MGGFGQRGGSGFLGTALTTAAGVAGGMLVGNALMNAFKGGEGEKAAGDQASFLSGGNESAGADNANAGITDSMYQDAGYDPGGHDEDYGSDGGDLGGDDWA
jgi:hypothetical protein